MILVDFAAAMAYCHWKNGRLPNYEQWVTTSKFEPHSADGLTSTTGLWEWCLEDHISRPDSCLIIRWPPDSDQMTTWPEIGYRNPDSAYVDVSFRMILIPDSHG